MGPGRGNLGGQVKAHLRRKVGSALQDDESVERHAFPTVVSRSCLVESVWGPIGV